MDFNAWIESNFGLFFMGGILLGFLVPGYFVAHVGTMPYVLMFTLFLVFLKTDVNEVRCAAAKPKTLAYVLLMNLLVIPVLVFFVFSGFEREILIGFLLLASLPSGVSSASQTDIIGGKTSLSLVLTVLSSLLAAFTIPVVFYFLLGTGLEVNFIALSLTLLQMIVLPFAASQLAKFCFKTMVAKTKKYYTSISILSSAFLSMVAMSAQAGYIMNNLSSVFYLLLLLYLVFFLFQFSTYFMAAWLKKEEKIAVSNSKTFMNTILGVVLAHSFFGQQTALLLVLAVIPWKSMLVVLKMYKKYLP